MPQWGTGLQTWVNSWVKTNTKHDTGYTIDSNRHLEAPGRGNEKQPEGKQQRGSSSPLHDRDGSVPSPPSEVPGWEARPTGRERRRKQPHQTRPQERKPNAVVGDGRAILQPRGGSQQYDTQHRHDNQDSSAGAHMRLWGHSLPPGQPIKSRGAPADVLDMEDDLESSQKPRALPNLPSKSINGDAGGNISLSTMTTMESSMMSKSVAGERNRSVSIVSALSGDDGGSNHRSLLSRVGRGDDVDSGKRGTSRRRRSGRLGRTNSQSDMLKMMAIKGQARRDSTASSYCSSDPPPSPRQRSLDYQQQQQHYDASPPVDHRNSDGGTTVQASNTAGGSGSLQPHQLPLTLPPMPEITGQYLNEAAFVRQQRTNELSGNLHRRNSSDGSSAAGRQRRPDRGEKAQPGGVAVPVPSGIARMQGPLSSNAYHHPRQQLLYGMQPPSPGCYGGQTGAAAAHARSHQPPAHQHYQNQRCPSCDELERRLLAAYSDIEYLRTVALGNDEGSFVCNECGGEEGGSGPLQGLSSSMNSAVSSSSVSRRRKPGRTNHVGSAGSSVASESLTLHEASQRLVEVTARHKRQIEQMTRERARWQNDMHLKLSKFAMMCKDLNEESAKRKEDAVAVLEEMSVVKTERDALASEIQGLRAKVVALEKESEENCHLREMLGSRDNDTLDRADDAISKRDAIIDDLSARLECTLDTLEMERWQHRQRRQIIFPVRQRSDDGVVEGGGSGGEEMKNLTAELARARDATRDAQSSLDAAKAMAAQRESEMQARCEMLARDLKEAQRQLGASSHGT